VISTWERPGEHKFAGRFQFFGPPPKSLAWGDIDTHAAALSSARKKVVWLPCAYESASQNHLVIFQPD
jgi:hypothetical protein